MPGSIKALRLQNLILGGGFTAAQLETELSNARAAGAFEASLRQRSVVSVIKNSSAAMAIAAGSPKAIAAILRQDTSIFSAIAADSAASAVMTSSASVMNYVAANSAARALIGTSGAIYNVIASASLSLGKYLAAIAGLDPVAYADMAAVVASSTAKTAIYNSDTALNLISGSTLAMAACRAAAQYSVKTVTENGTTSVSLSWGGGPYIVLGYSRAVTSVRTATLTTLRPGSSILASIPSGGTNNAIAQDANVAIPVTGPLTFKLDGTGTNSSYLGALRCDI